MKKSKVQYRILSADRRIMYTGGNSWMTLETARKLVNYDRGEMIYEFTYDTQEPMWECF